MLRKVCLGCNHLEVAAAMSNRFLVAAVYIPPTTPFPKISEDLQHMLDKIQGLTSRELIQKVVVIGDFNINFQQMTSLQPMMESQGLSQIVSEPTHQLGSILDVLFTNITDYNLANIPVWFSDHHAVIMTSPI